MLQTDTQRFWGGGLAPWNFSACIFDSARCGLSGEPAVCLHAGKAPLTEYGGGRVGHHKVLPGTAALLGLSGTSLILLSPCYS